MFYQYDTNRDNSLDLSEVSNSTLPFDVVAMGRHYHSTYSGADILVSLFSYLCYQTYFLTY